MELTQDKLYCKCGAEIPDNVKRYESKERGCEGPTKRPGLIACRKCAAAAGGKIHFRQKAAKGRDLEKYGQQTVHETMGSIPMLEIK